MAQTNGGTGIAISDTAPHSPPENTQPQTNQSLTIIARAGQVRAACIQNRRLICGRILNVLPEGLVVDSGYTNLLREPLIRSWLVPGTVTASRATRLVEGHEPDAVCVGRVFLMNLPKSRRLKPKPYDYVILEGYPAGQYTYTSLGTIQRNIRNFSAVLEKAVSLNLQAEARTPPPVATIK